MEVLLNTLAITSYPNISFGQLLEPRQNKYTSKQEHLSSQIREIVNAESPFYNRKGSYVERFEKELNSDILILPCEHRKKIDVFAIDKISGQKDIIKMFAPETKPSEQYFKEYLEYTKEDIKEKNLNFVAMLVAGILAITAFYITGNKNAGAKTVEPMKKEVSHSLTRHIPKDTLEISAKMFK